MHCCKIEQHTLPISCGTALIRPTVSSNTVFISTLNCCPSIAYHDGRRRYSSASLLISVASFRPCWTGMLQHAFYNPVCTFAVVVDLGFILLNVISYFGCQLQVAGCQLFFNSPINSVLTSEKLFTKFSGFCISCAIPAVSSPNEAIFSDCISCFCVSLSSISVFRSATLHLPVFKSLHNAHKRRKKRSQVPAPRPPAYQVKVFTANIKHALLKRDKLKCKSFRRRIASLVRFVIYLLALFYQ